MSRRALAVGGVVLALGGFAVGRLSRGPARIEQRQEVVSFMAAHLDARERVVQGPVRIVTKVRTVPGPSGPVREVERTEERGPVVTERQQHTEVAQKDEAKSETKLDARPRFYVGLTADQKLSALLKGEAPQLGGEVKYRVGGPFWLGLGANTAGHVQASVGITF